jgi:predicted transcriptional regulator
MLSAEERTRIEEIIWCEGEAEEIVSSAQREADKLRWDAAKLITEELDAGKTQFELAKLIGKSQTHVSVMRRMYKAKIADYYLGNDQSFDAKYKAMLNRPREETVAEVKELHDQGMSKTLISKSLGIPRTTIRSYLDEEEDENPLPPSDGTTRVLRDGKIVNVPTEELACGRLNLFPGYIKDFKKAAKSLLESRYLKEEVTSLDEVQKLINKYQNQLDKIRKEFH